MGPLLSLVRVFLAALFAISGLAKLRETEPFRETLSDLGVPALMARSLARGIPLLELGVAGLLLVPATAWWGALLALGLLCLFTVVLVTSLRLGRTPDCHCLGRLGSKAIGWDTVMRNLGLVAVAGTLVLAVPERTGTGWQALAPILPSETALLMGTAAALLVLLGSMGWLVLSLWRQQGRLLLRIEALESAAGSRPPPASASTTVPVGEPAPQFTLPAVGGEEISLDGLRTAGHPVLLLFTDPDCDSCKPVLREAGRWQRDLGDRLSIAVMSRGDEGTNRAHAGEYGLESVLLQSDFEVAAAYGIEGTPSAVLVRDDGRIGSTIARGPDGVRALVARAVRRRPDDELVNGASAPDRRAIALS